MERLTKRLSSGVVSWNYSNDCYGEDETRNKVFKSVHRQNACEKLAAIEDILGDEYDLDRLRELAEADREGRCVVLDGKSRDKELICKLVRLFYWLEDCVKKKDFSPFRIVAGAPEKNIHLFLRSSASKTNTSLKYT